MRISVSLFFTIILNSVSIAQADLKKVYYLDTNYVHQYTEAYYVGCSKKIVDTVFTINYNLRSQGHWQIFYDKNFQVIQSEYFTRNDTAFAIKYFPNGQKKKEERTVEGFRWIFLAEWCENGQLTSSGNPQNPNYRTVITYHCNGNKKWQGNLYIGRAWGLMTYWYENGQKQSESLYTEFNQELADKQQLENKLISEKFWDESGNQVPVLDNVIININTLGAPIIIPDSNLIDKTAYYNIMNQADYDNTMSAFKEKVYKNAKLKTQGRCKCGLVYVSFVVSKNGKINNIKVENSLEESIDMAFVEAIKKIGKWKPAILNGKKVDVIVMVALELEKIK